MKPERIVSGSHLLKAMGKKRNLKKFYQRLNLHILKNRVMIREGLVNPTFKKLFSINLNIKIHFNKISIFSLSEKEKF